MNIGKSKSVFKNLIVAFVLPCVLLASILCTLFLTVNAEPQNDAPEITVTDFTETAASGDTFNVPKPVVTAQGGATIQERTVTVLDVYGDAITLSGTYDEGYSFEVVRSNEYYDVVYYAKDSEDRENTKTFRITVTDGFSKMDLTKHFSTSDGFTIDYTQTKDGVQAMLGPQINCMIQYDKPLSQTNASTVQFKADPNDTIVDFRLTKSSEYFQSEGLLFRCYLPEGGSGTGSNYVTIVNHTTWEMSTKSFSYTLTDCEFTIVFDPVAHTVKVNDSDTIDLTAYKEELGIDFDTEIPRYPVIMGGYLTSPRPYIIRQIGDAVFTRPYTDTIAPRLQIANQPEKMYEVTKSFTFDAIAADNLDDEYDFYVKVNDTFVQGKTYTFDQLGEVKICLYAYDNYGNFAKSDEYTVTVVDDIQPPVLTIENEYEIPYTLFEGVSAIFPVAKVTDNVDSGLAQTMTVKNASSGNVKVEAIYDENERLRAWKVTPVAADVNADAAAEVIYSATDKTGNTGTLSISVKILGKEAADKTAPDLIVADLEKEYSMGAKVALPLIEVTDNVDEKVATYFEIYRDGKWVYTSEIVENADFKEKDLDLSLDIPGKYTVRFVAVDDYENETIVEKSFVVKSVLQNLDDLIELNEAEEGKGSIEKTANGYVVTSQVHWSGGITLHNQKVGQPFRVGLIMDEGHWVAGASDPQLDVQVRTDIGYVYLKVYQSGKVEAHLWTGSGFSLLKSLNVPLNADNRKLFEVSVDIEGNVLVNGTIMADSASVAHIKYNEKLIHVSVSPAFMDDDLTLVTGEAKFTVASFGGANISFDENGDLKDFLPVVLSNNVPATLKNGEELEISAAVFDLQDYYPTYTYVVKDASDAVVELQNGKFCPTATGTYTIVFTVNTIDGRTNIFSETLVVIPESVDAPTIQIQGSYESSYLINSEITVLDFIATDNLQLAPQKTIIVYNPLGMDVDLKDGKFTASREGTWKIKYVATGATGLQTEQVVDIVVKAEKDDDKDTGCGGSIVAGSALAVSMGCIAAAGAVVLLIKRRKDR